MKYIFIFLMSLFPFFIQASESNKYIVKGVVVDSIDNKVIDFATIVVANHSDHSVLNSMMSDQNGAFYLNLKSRGVVDIEVSYLGYNTFLQKNIHIDTSSINLGVVKLVSMNQELSRVDIIAQKRAVANLPSKSTMFVASQLTATSGTAVDVLENLPSIKVDTEGELSIRGNSGITVLIDGKPTILEPQDALSQLPSSVIEKIDVMTQPSAKYDPDGMGGVINIITKKQDRDNFSGKANTYVGMYQKYGGDITLNFNKNKNQYTLGTYYNVRAFPADILQYNVINEQDTLWSIDSYGDRTRKGHWYGGNFAFTRNISKQDQINIQFKGGGRRLTFDTNLDYTEELKKNESTQVNRYVNNEVVKWRNYFGGINLNNTFKNRNHELYSELFYSRTNDSDHSITEQYMSNKQLNNGMSNTEQGPSNMFRFRMDYSYIWSENQKIELGYQSRVNRNYDNTSFSEYDPYQGDYIIDDEYCKNTKYILDIHSGYLSYDSKLWDKLDYQLGVRVEYENREVENKQDGSFERIKVDAFPSFNISYNWNSSSYISVAYSRRIERPMNYLLEPFITWDDTYNFTQGNPNIKPEYINSVELGYKSNIGRQNISITSYFKKITNKTEWIQEVYEGNIMKKSPQNIGISTTVGGELLLSSTPFNNLSVDLTSNVFYYHINGDYKDYHTNRSNVGWDIRLNTSYTFPWEIKLQANAYYNGKQITLQGDQEGYFDLKIAGQKQFFHKSLSMTFEVSDVASTKKKETYSEGNNFQNYQNYDYKSPVFVLNLSYKIK